MKDNNKKNIIVSFIIGILALSLLTNVYLFVDKYNNENEQSKKQNKIDEIYSEYFDVSLMDGNNCEDKIEVYLNYKEVSISLKNAATLVSETSYVNNEDAELVQQDFLFYSYLIFTSHYIENKSNKKEIIDTSKTIKINESLMGIKQNIGDQEKCMNYLGELNQFLGSD